MIGLGNYSGLGVMSFQSPAALQRFSMPDVAFARGSFRPTRLAPVFGGSSGGGASSAPAPRRSFAAPSSGGSSFIKGGGGGGGAYIKQAGGAGTIGVAAASSGSGMIPGYTPGTPWTAPAGGTPFTKGAGELPVAAPLTVDSGYYSGGGGGGGGGSYFDPTAGALTEGGEEVPAEEKPAEGFMSGKGKWLVYGGIAIAAWLLIFRRKGR